MSKKRKTINFDPSVCCFCKIPSDERNLGKFFISECGFAVHQYCMFFSAALPQRGRDEDGFEGFLENDILKEYRRASLLRCCICRKTGASAGCCKKSCKKTFHFPCGVANQYLFQFYDQFSAHCSEHRPHQKSFSTSNKTNKVTKCVICLDNLVCDGCPDVLTAPCCKDTWFHKSCVQEQAIASGYFFRCAVCNDSDKFIKEMKVMGIYVPDRDAAWEEGENFADLLEKYERCDSFPCKCPSGSTFSDDSGPWEIVLCASCGQYGTHIACRYWAATPQPFFCPTCKPVHERSDEEAITATRDTNSRHEPFSRASVDRDRVRSSEKYSRKMNTRSRKKRVRVHSDDEEISVILNGLTRQENEDFLDMDTKRIVQRALAAGKAVTANQKTPTIINRKSLENKERERTDSLSNASQEGNASDDDCVITKYIPGCRICPKCNRLKSIRTVDRAVVRTGLKKPVARSASTVVSSCAVAPSVKNDFSENRIDNTSKLLRPPFMESLNACVTTSAVTVEKGFETIERAAQETNKTSVLLVSPSSKDSKSPLKALKAATCDLEATAENRFEVSSSVQDIVRNVTSETRNQELSSFGTYEFSMNSVKRICEMFALESSERAPKVNSEDAVKNISSKADEPKDSPPISKTLSSLSSTTSNHDSKNGDVDSNFGAGFPFPSEVRNTQNSAAEMSISNYRSNTPDDSETVTDREFEQHSRITRSKNRLRFSRSDPEKTVLEAALDHAYQLRSSGKEMTHQCLTSF